MYLKLEALTTGCSFSKNYMLSELSLEKYHLFCCWRDNEYTEDASFSLHLRFILFGFVRRALRASEWRLTRNRLCRPPSSAILSCRKNSVIVAMKTLKHRKCQRRRRRFNPPLATCASNNNDHWSTKPINKPMSICLPTINFRKQCRFV